MHSLVRRARYRLFLALRHGTNVRHPPPPAVDRHMTYSGSDLARMGEFDTAVAACHSARRFGCGVEGVPEAGDPAEPDDGSAAVVQFKPARGKSRMDGVVSEDEFVRGLEAATESGAFDRLDDGLILAPDTGSHACDAGANSSVASSSAACARAGAVWDAAASATADWWSSAVAQHACPGQSECAAGC